MPVVFLKENKIHIGCSGYYYPQWKGPFYPPKAKPAGFLSYYSTVFNTVELNSSFYHTPRLSSLQKNYDAVPSTFRFSTKMSRYVTHILRLRKSRKMILEFKSLLEDGLREKLSCILYQLPPSFVCTEENIAHILENIPQGQDSVIELRHASWWTKEVLGLFKKHRLSFCSVSFPGLPEGFFSTTGLSYLRMHGVPDLFKSAYADTQLQDIRKEVPESAKELFVYFNNTYYSAAVENALRLKKLFSR